ncbi:MAG: hypothetical protein K9M57_07930 [Phycisphaerae bacterium]|nr:hypothetical protein [Phycisphaerae bacterium]
MSNKEVTDSGITDYAKSLAICAQQDDRIRQIIEAWDGLSEEQKAAMIDII